MRKIILLLIGFIIFLPINVNASNFEFEASEYIGWTYVLKIKDNYRKYEQTQVIRNKANGEVVYCIEPFKLIGDGFYNITDDSLINLSQEDIDLIKAIAYFGFGYEDHYAHKWYAAAQIMIWRIVEPDAQIVFTTRLNGSIDNSIYLNEINELQGLVDSYFNYVESNRNITVYKDVPTNIILNDIELNSNQVVSGNLNVINNSITINESKDKEMFFDKSFAYYEKDSYIYNHDTGQDIVGIGDLESKRSIINVKVVSGEVKLINYDEENNLYKNNVYGLFDENDNLINSGNNATFSLPDFGVYYIKQISSEIGYEEDSNKYYFTVDENNLDHEIVTISKKIKVNFNFINYYEDFQSSEQFTSNVSEFSLYDSDNNLITKFNPVDGSFNLELEFGKYKLEQNIVLNNFIKTYTNIIEVNNNNDINYKVINYEKVSRVKIVNRDYDSLLLLNIKGIRFKLYDDQDQLYCFNLKCEFETNDISEALIDGALDIGKYYIKQVNLNLEKYDYNDDRVYFEITFDSLDLVEVDFYNKLILVNDLIENDIVSDDINDNFENNEVVIEKPVSSENINIIEVPDTKMNRISLITCKLIFNLLIMSCVLCKKMLKLY